MDALVMIQTNDIHSHFQPFFDAMAQVQQKITEYQEAGMEYCLIDCGDFTDRFHPLTDATNGQYNTELLEQYHYDYVTIGNNEGLGNTHQQLDELYQSFTGTVLVSNLIDRTTKQLPQWAKGYEIRRTKSGKKILFFGLTAPFADSYRRLDWTVIDPRLILPRIYERFADEVDGFVLISHLGRHTDDELAEQYPWLNVILGSHTHHFYPAGKKLNHTTLTGAGKWGQVVSIATLDLATMDCTVETIDMANFPAPDSATKATILDERGQQLLSERKVGYLSHSYSAREFAAWTTEKLQAKYKADGCFLNTGLFLTDLPQGEVSAYDIQQCLPHPMHVMEVWLPGDEMRRFLHEISKNRHYLQRFHLVGMGFRGVEFGDILSASWQEKKGEWFYQGQPIDDQRLYHFVTVDHYYYVPYFPTLSYVGKVKVHMNHFLRAECASLLSNGGFK